MGPSGEFQMSELPTEERMMCESCTFTHSLTIKLLVAAKEVGGLQLTGFAIVPP